MQSRVTQSGGSDLGGAAHGYVWTFLCGEIARYGRGAFIVSSVGKQLGNKLNTSRRLAGGLQIVCRLGPWRGDLIYAAASTQVSRVVCR